MAAETTLLNSARCHLPSLLRPRTVHYTCFGSSCQSTFRHRRPYERWDQSVPHLRTRPQLTASPSSSSAHKRRCQVAAHATLQEGHVAEPHNGGARELLTWISELPWARVAIWATVAVTASQFQDFFGVCTVLLVLQHTKLEPSLVASVDSAASCGMLTICTTPAVCFVNAC